MSAQFETFSTFETTYLNEWKIKISGITGQILVVMYNIITCETHFRFFDTPREAGMWIEYLAEK
jgi:hypothetical protein